MLVVMELSRIKGLERIDGEKGLYPIKKREQCMMHAPFEILAPRAGFEPATCGLTVRRSTG